MADTYDADTRSRTMRRVKGRDTSPEMLLRRAMFAIGIRGWRCHRSDIPGNPDITFGKYRLVIFVDGAFWHGHPSKYWLGRSGEYWDLKIGRNIERDKRVTKKLVEDGWNVLRFWDFEVEAGPTEIARRVKTVLERVSGGEHVVEVHEMEMAEDPPPRIG